MSESQFIKKRLYFGNTKCPLDNKRCDAMVAYDYKHRPERRCRYGMWNSNVEQPKCGLEIDRKKKSVRSKAKRKKSCGCK